MKKLIALLLLPLTALLAHAAPVSGEPAPKFEAKDDLGNVVRLEDFAGKIVVLEWFNHGCPFVKKFYQSGNMQKMQEKLTGEGVIWLSINSGAPGKQGHLTAEQSVKTRAELGVKSTHVILDEQGVVGKKYDARTTPHMYVIDEKGILVYQGAIDSINTAKAEDISKATNYVKAAWKALKAGEPVDPSTTRAYGCSVKY
jgi:peroxiredoxin